MHIACTCAEKARSTTLNDEKYNWSYQGAVPIDRTCIVVMALCNQPEAFTLDLGDDQSCYLYCKLRLLCMITESQRRLCKLLCFKWLFTVHLVIVLCFIVLCCLNLVSWRTFRLETFAAPILKADDTWDFVAQLGCAHNKSCTCVILCCRLLQQIIQQKSE